MSNILYIVVPCYNEQEVLPETSKRLREKVQTLRQSGKIDADSRILFVNDGSKDATWEMVQKLHEENSVFSGVNLSRNRGHQNALLAGIAVAAEHADMIVSMDADLQDDVDAMDRMIDAYETGNDIVYGVRSSRQKDTFFKRNTAQLFYRMLHFLGAEIVYNHADYRLLSRRAAKGLLSFEEVNLFLRGIVPMVGYQSTTVTYERGERFAGESKYPLGKMVAFALEGVTSLSVKPIRMITMGGLFVCLVSLGMLIKAFVDYANGNVEPGWTSVIISIWVLGGLQLFAIGIIGEYIGKKGHQKVGYIGVYETDQAVGIERRNGVLDGLKEYGITPVTGKSDYSFIGGQTVTRELLERESDLDAIICATDRLAFGAYKILHEHKKRIPEEVSVAAFGGYDESTLLTPELTTLKFDSYGMGYLGAETILKMITGEPVSKKQIVGYEFIEGGSVRS